MKQIPTNVPLHSLSSLSKADLSLYDSVDDQVLSDYAVSIRPHRPLKPDRSHDLTLISSNST